MNGLDGDLASLAASQAWQLTALVLAVLLATRWWTRRRPHLAYVLWLLVLIKCLTPPLWSAPSGLFCWVQTGLAAVSEATVQPPTNAGSRLRTPLTERERIPPRKAAMDGALIAEAEALHPASNDPLGPSLDNVSPAKRLGLRGILLGLWLVGVGVLVTVTLWRCWRFVRALRHTAIPYAATFDELVARLSRQLRMRARVRLWVTSSRCGPAVVGLFRPVIVLPELVVQGKRPEDLEPILAHELIHVRRGDLWLGLLQAAAKALWWFHPLVWLAARLSAREAERCCDEEVVGSLGCDPARYARSLLEILELKRTLQPVPAFPGMKPVDVTSQRLERIMQLRQGCRRRTPWWCWLVLVLAAAATLPGSAWVAVEDEPRAATPAAEEAQTPAPTSTPSYRGVGVNSDAEVTGPVVVDKTPPDPCVTTPAAAPEPEGVEPDPDDHYVLVHNVADLVGADGWATAVTQEQRARSGAVMTAALDQLVRRVRSEISADTWDNAGGPGRIEGFSTNLSLIVSQTPRTHLAIHDYLNNFRKQEGLPPNPKQPQFRRPPRDAGAIQIRVYAVADLVIPGPMSASSTKYQPIKPDFSALIDLITSTIAPSSWSDVGGVGTTTTVPINLSLVIEQTASVHQQIAELLEQLRTLQDVQVTVETRFLGLPERLFGLIGKDFPGADGPAEDGSAFARQGWIRVGEEVAARLLNACQGDDRAPILQGPKLTLFNSQVARVASEDQDAKFSLQYQGVVAADGKSVQLTVLLGRTPPGSSPRTHSVRIPEGSALLLDATDELQPWAEVQSRGEDASILKRIPYVSRLLSNPPQRRIDHVVLLITPRIVIVKDEPSAVASPHQHSEARR